MSIESEKQKVDKILTNIPELLQNIGRYCSDSFSVSDAKTLLAYIATKVQKMNNKDTEQVCLFIREQLKPRVGIFMREDAQFKRIHAEVLETKDGMMIDAARLLTTIQYEQKDEQQKIQDWIWIAEMYFDLKEPDAEIYVNKVSSFELEGIEKLRHAKLIAMVKDSNRQYTDAAERYYKLAITQEKFPDENGVLINIDVGEQQDLYNKSVVCTILSDANSRKERLIHLLYKDERSKLNEHSNLLEAMALGKVLKKESTKNFEAKLEEHQKVRFPDGYTSLEKALIEHNIKVLSKIYLNITFGELGMFLGISAQKAEEITAKMIGEKRITAVLDQINEIVEFDDASHQQHTLNAQISDVCQNVEFLTRDILTAHPSLESYLTFIK